MESAMQGHAHAPDSMQFIYCSTPLDEWCLLVTWTLSCPKVVSNIFLSFPMPCGSVTLVLYISLEMFLASLNTSSSTESRGNIAFLNAHSSCFSSSLSSSISEERRECNPRQATKDCEYCLHFIPNVMNKKRQLHWQDWTVLPDSEFAQTLNVKMWDSQSTDL